MRISRPSVELFESKTPKTVANFAGLAEGTKEWQHPKTGVKSTTPCRDGIVFHRIIRGFVIQAATRSAGSRRHGYQFEDEFHPELRHDRAGILSMANAGPNTNGSQFFITLGPTPHLDRAPVFAVVKGRTSSRHRQGADRPQRPPDHAGDDEQGHDRADLSQVAGPERPAYLKLPAAQLRGAGAADEDGRRRSTARDTGCRLRWRLADVRGLHDCRSMDPDVSRRISFASRSFSVRVTR